MSWFTQLVQGTLTALYTLFTLPIVEIGGNKLSLAAIGWLILLGLLVLFMSRLLSQWLKRNLLSRMGLDRGTQEAIAVVTGYFLAGLGIVVVLQTAGVNLSSLAVLAGVLGIGIGFGLQNLASNFISGLVVLFERPIKVGDFVEVNHMLGTVEKISIRSTTIRTEDNVFVIIPNTHLIENNIVNWSYNSSQCRIRVPIGVAYGTDPLVVTEALLAAARMEADVLSHPSPKVLFKKFGDSALQFELLVWINKPEENDFIESALNFLIEQELRRRNIEVPFPQMEVRIKNLDDLKSSLRSSLSPEAADYSPLDVNVPTLENSSLAIDATQSWTLRVLLRRVAYFEQCTDIELRQLIEHGYRQFFAQGTVICRENDPGESFYIILSGSVEVFSHRAGKYIATLHAGEFFGEISLLIGTPRSATVSALEDTILFVVDHNDLQKLLSDHQGLAEQIAQKLAERQQVLQALGILDEGALKQLGETPLSWIRKRIHTLFRLS